MGARDGEDKLIEVVLHDVGQAAEQDEEHGHLLRVLRARVYVEKRKKKKTFHSPE